MKKILLVAAAASALFSTSTQAAQIGLVNGVVGTVQAVLVAPGATVASLLTERHLIVGKLPATGLNVVNALVPLLTGQAVKPTTQTIIVPLPGPDFLNMTLVDLPSRIGVSVKASGPISVTVTTGQP